MTPKSIFKIVAWVIAIYLLLSVPVCLRTMWWAPPEQAAQAYINAIKQRDPTGIYLYSDMLGPHLAGMMAKSNMDDDSRRHMWAKDFARWKSEFEKGGAAQDSTKRERRLLHGQVLVERVDGKDFKAEVKNGEVTELVSYNDTPGETRHFFYRLTYPSAEVAPPVAILDNVRTGKQRRIRSVVIRVEVRRRPDVEPPATWFLGWDWLDAVAPVFPHRVLFGPAPAEQVWMAQISFAVDKLSLDTF